MFVLLAAYTAIILLSVTTGFTFLLYSGILNRYRELLAIITFAAVFALIFEIAVVFSILIIGKGSEDIGQFSFLLRIGLGILLPFFIYLAGLFKWEKYSLRKLYISINNCLSRVRLKGIAAGRLIVLLPHCMQNKDCMCKITEDIQNCKRCGRCKIGEIAGIVGRYGVQTAVAKGGTAARNIVKEARPDFILAVACERDLVGGIADVGRIPVIGIINQRPNGYCNNTTVDMAEFKYTLQTLLESIAGHELHDSEIALDAEPWNV